MLNTGVQVLVQLLTVQMYGMGLMQYVSTTYDRRSNVSQFYSNHSMNLYMLI
jgi:hypothetical protein